MSHKRHGADGMTMTQDGAMVIVGQYQYLVGRPYIAHLWSVVKGASNGRSVFGFFFLVRYILRGLNVGNM